MTIISAMMIISKYSLPTIDFATRYSTRYSNFLLQPYWNPTRSKKAYSYRCLHMMQCNYIQNYAIPYATIQFHAVPCDAMWCNWIICIFGPLGPYSSLPNCRMGTFRKTKGIQIYFRIWGCYDPIGSALPEPKRAGLYGCSVNKSDFSIELYRFIGLYWIIGFHQIHSPFG